MTELKNPETKNISKTEDLFFLDSVQPLQKTYNPTRKTIIKIIKG